MSYIRGDTTWGSIKIDKKTYEILYNTCPKIPDKAWEYKQKHNFFAGFGNPRRYSNYEVMIKNNKLYLTNIEFREHKKSGQLFWSDNLINNIFNKEKIFLKNQNSEIKLLVNKEIKNLCNIQTKGEFHSIKMQLLILNFKNGELISSSNKEVYTSYRALKNYIEN